MTVAVIKNERSQFLFTRKVPARRRILVVCEVTATVLPGFTALPVTAGDSPCDCFLPSAGGLIAPNNSFTIAQGANVILLVSVTNQCGDAVDLTGSSLFFSAKDCFDDQFPKIYKASSDILQINIFDPIHGRAYVYLLPADTRTLGPGKFLYDLWVRLPSGEAFPLIMNASFVVARSVYTPPP